MKMKIEEIKIDMKVKVIISEDVDGIIEYGIGKVTEIDGTEITVTPENDYPYYCELEDIVLTF